MIKIKNLKFKVKSYNVKFKILLIFSVVISLAVLILIGRYFFLKSDKPPETYIEEAKNFISEAPEAIVDKEEKLPKTESEEKLPEKIFIDVPFTSQAPFGIWDEKHEEACEEAALIMLHAYLKNEKLDKEKSEKEIQNMIDFEIKKYGDYKDSDASQAVKIAEDYYGIKNLKVIYDFSKEDIKKELAKGEPVIVPAAGRELGNPYYTAPGPLYHMLVLAGYSGNEIITNDPGTRKGEGYRYKLDILFNAIHDFPGEKEKIKEGRKAMIVIEK